MNDLQTMTLLFGLAIVGASAFWSLAPKRKRVRPDPDEPVKLDPDEVIARLFFSDEQKEAILDAYMKEHSSVAFIASGGKLPPMELVDFIIQLQQPPTTIFERQRKVLLAFADRRDLAWFGVELLYTDPKPRPCADSVTIKRPGKNVQQILRSYYQEASPEPMEEIDGLMMKLDSSLNSLKPGPGRD